MTVKKINFVFNKDIKTNGINTIPKIKRSSILELQICLYFKIVLREKYPMKINTQVINVLINIPFSNNTSNKVKKNINKAKVKKPSKICCIIEVDLLYLYIKSLQNLFKSL